MRESTVFYRSFYEAIKELDAELQSEVYSAIFEYALNFTEVELKGVAKTVFTLIKPQLDANQKRFENGNKPKVKQVISKTKAKPKQNKSNVEANVNVNDNVNDNANDNDNEKANVTMSRFRAPAYDDILNFMKEKNSLAGNIWPDAKVLTEAKAFFNYYESNGWMVGKNKMKNWEAAVRNWMNNNSKFDQNQKPNTYGKPTTTADHIAKAEQLFRDAVAISHARDKARQDSGTTEA